jgi:rRNA processing protein Krr1/Pno1
MVKFPQQNSDDRTIRVEGPKSVVDKIIAIIEQFAADRDNQITENVEVAPSKHRLLIGPNGDKRRAIENEFSVTLDIPRQNTMGPSGQQIKISGPPSNVEKAKNHILEITKEQAGETIDVPLHLHHVIADNNNFFRTLSRNYQVKVDHGNKKPPPRPSSSVSPRPPVLEGNLPLITDDPTSSELNYSWGLVEAPQSAESAETIPWILSGPPAGVSKAKQLIETKMSKGGQANWTGFLRLPDPKYHGLVVGPGGSKIKQLKEDTGTQINVPKVGSRDDAIEISGDKAGCEAAKDRIIELISQQASQSGRNSRRESNVGN